MPSTPQQDAADQAAQADIDAGNPEFYGEIGDINGNILWSGGFGTSPPARSSQMSIASASKPFYSAWCAQNFTLNTTDDWPHLCMADGRDNMGGNKCTTTDTVGYCATKPNPPPMGATNADYVMAHDGKFAYDGEPFQWHAATTAIGLGSKNVGPLIAVYRNPPTGTPPGLGLGTDSYFTNTGLAGGMKSTAQEVAGFLVKVLDGTLAIGDIIYSRSFEVNASEYFTDGSVLHSPAEVTEPWTFGPWWRDPANGSFIGAGSFGFVFGITADRSMYFIIARSGLTSGGEMGAQSIDTSRSILRAFQTAVGPLDANADSTIGPITAPSTMVTSVTQFLFSGSTWTVPNDCTLAKVECIGGGASGWIQNNNNGGIGGDYSEVSYIFTPNSTVSIQVGAGGAATSGGVTNPGSDTWMKTGSGTLIVLACGGASGSVSFGNTGAAGGGSYGPTQLAGGGGAGGKFAAGNPSATATGATTGGQGDGTYGGTGGTTSSAGADGTEWSAGGVTVGSGGGGGGSPNFNGGHGGNYGGGGGGARSHTPAFTAGAGADGVIVITYNTPA